MRTFVSLCCGAMRNPVAKCFASIALMSPMYTHIRTIRCVYVCTMKRGAPVANSRIKLAHKQRGVTLLVVYVCACICVKMFIHLSTRLWFRYSLRATPLLVFVCCRINQLNYLWWWINRFVFRWRAQLAALSTTNCRRIEWWNLERERVLGQSQCYSWFRGFFLTQLHVSERYGSHPWFSFLSGWWIGSLPSYQRISIPSVTY